MMDKPRNEPCYCACMRCPQKYVGFWYYGYGQMCPCGFVHTKILVVKEHEPAISTVKEYLDTYKRKMRSNEERSISLLFLAKWWPKMLIQLYKQPNFEDILPESWVNHYHTYILQGIILETN